MTRSVQRNTVAGAALMFALLATGRATALACPSGGPEVCLVDGRMVDAATCQERADADWEGLSSEEQRVLLATGLSGRALDQLVIDFRQAKLDAAQRRAEIRDIRLEQDPDGHWRVRS